MLIQFINDNFQNSIQIESSESKPRIEFIDLAKGLCIFLVVVYHTEIIRFDIPGLKALRMPLYFILSGLFFKTYGGIIQHTIKKINKILIPFIFFYLLSWLELSLLDIAPWNVKPTVQPIYALFTERIGPIWFLECLFLTTVFFCILSILVRNEIAKFAVVFTMGGIGYFLSINRIYMPCQLDVVFSAMPFFFFGYILKQTPLLYPSKHDIYSLPIGLILLAIGVVLYNLLNKPSIEFWDNSITGNLIYNYVISLFVVIGTLLLCKFIKWLPIISYIGRYSIIVLVMHQIFLDFIRTFEPYLLGYGINYIYFVFTFTLSWISIPILRKYIPQFTAQQDLVTIDKLASNLINGK